MLIPIRSPICISSALDALRRRTLPAAGGVAGVALLAFWLVMLAAHRRGLALVATLISAVLVSAGPIAMIVLLCAILGRSLAKHASSARRIRGLARAPEGSAAPNLSSRPRGRHPLRVANAARDLHRRMEEDAG